MSIIRIILRGLFCLALCFFVWEACARLDQTLRYGAPLMGSYGYSTMLTYDDLGVKGRPHGQYLKWKLNSYGYRSPEPRWDLERIVSIGASETFGMFESDNMEYPRQLEHELNARAGAERYQVINVAYAGQSIGSFSRRAREVAAELQPHMALIYPSLIPYVNPPPESGDPVEWVKGGARVELRLWPKLFNLIDSLPDWISTMRYSYHIWKETRHATVINRIPESNVARFDRDLSRLLDRLQERRVTPVLVTHATYFGASVEPDERAMLLAWRRFEPTLSDEGFLDMEGRMNEVIRREAAARKLLLVDAANRMLGHENFADWVHFTDRGAHKMARLIADKLTTGQLLAVSN